jgi:hypothetical protein
VLLILVWFPALWTLWGTLVTVATSCGAILLLSQIARDRGKQREPELYAAWGGKPSVAMLRNRDQRIDENSKARYRSFLNRQLPDLIFPTGDEEQADPQRADGIYESVTAWLLTQTRDTKVFSLLFRENISYGFRRNLWGLKPVGLGIALLSACASTLVIIYQYVGQHSSPPAEIVILTGLVWLLVVVWAVRVTPAWVRVPADAYGRQLLAACDTLASSKGTSRRKPAN